MLTRRNFICGSAAALVSAFGFAGTASASDSRLLADILDGVSDALVRDYIREHYQEDGSRWDGHYWWRDGKKYTPHEYREFLSHEYREKGPGRGPAPKDKGPAPKDRGPQGKGPQGREPAPRGNGPQGKGPQGPNGKGPQGKGPQGGQPAPRGNGPQGKAPQGGQPAPRGNAPQNGQRP